MIILTRKKGSILAHTLNYKTPPKYKTYKDRAVDKFHDQECISKEDFEAMSALCCHYCGKDGPNGIDRIDNQIGYIKENCVPACKHCNYVKGDLSLEDFNVWKNRFIAKQLAERTVGKTPLFYGGDLTAPIAYKWKISWNETAKNVSFYNQYPEFSHNEFMGWTSHPVEKPFAVFDIQSSFERPRIAERMSLTDSMLSGKRPKASVITLEGESLVRQFLWGLALADMTSIYGAILNGVDPTPVGLIEKFKASLS